MNRAFPADTLAPFMQAADQGIEPTQSPKTPLRGSKTGDFLSSIRSRSTRFAERNRRAALVVEVIAALVIVVSASCCLFRIGKSMATTSLWNDELYTIIHYTSKGPA